MDNIKRALLVALCVYFGISHAQQVTVDNSVPLQELIENNLVQGCVDISNIASSVNGYSVGLGSYGYFERGNSNFPFENGIVITTGNANSAGNTLNTEVLNEGTSSWPTDPDLETALGISGTLNATSIEFDFISISNQIQFNYILASEEYFGNFPCEYSDGFAFLIREAGTSSPYTNIALIPGTTVPVNTNTVHDEIVGFCNASYPEFFEGYNLGDTNYNGRTTVLSATATIQPNVQYEIKLIIADQTDQNYDSAVFIQGNSFNATVNLGEDFSTCASNVTLDGDINNPNANYSWYFNDNLINGADQPTFDAVESGNYRVEIEIQLSSENCIIEDDINITLSSTQSSGPLTDFVVCDDSSADGVEFFDLSTKDSEVLASVPASSYTISYHNSAADAQNNTNPILGVIQNVSNPQTIYVRIDDATSGCLAFSDFNLIVNPLPVISTPSPLIVCDDQTADGVTTIDLTQKNDEIINGSSNLQVTYHLSASDAASGSNPIAMPYTNTSGNQLIYVSVVNPQTGCRTTTTLDVTVLEIPAIDTGIHYIDACDADHDGFAEFDLTTAIAEVLDGLTGVTVSFYETYEDALNGLNPIANETNYANTVEEEQVVYIRVESNTTGCAAVTPIEIHTNLLLTATNIRDRNQCDIDNDGYEEFIFGDIAWGIINEIPDISVEFYESEEDRDNGINPINQLTPYPIQSNPQTIYLTLTSPTCTDVAQIQLVLTPVFQFESVGNLTVCDEDQDGFTTIDLTQFDELVTSNESGYSTSYFLTEEDALANTNALPNQFTNTTNPVILYPRITSDDTGCSDVTSFEIDVLPAPETNTLNDILVCDADGDAEAIFDLTVVNAQVVNSLVNRTITFHNSLEDANSGLNPISNSSNYTGQTETIFLRIENNSTGCFATEALNLVVNALPYAGTLNNEMSAYNVCENESDGVAEFIFETKDAEALDGQTGKIVTYYLTASDAENKLNPINKTLPFSNTSNPQTIHLRIDNLSDENCYTTAAFEIAVGSNPEFNEPSDIFVCDDISNDGAETFDFVNKINEITNGISGIEEVSFYANASDAIAGTNPLNLDFTNTVNPQEIFVQIDNGTICNSITSFVINVIQVPEVNPSMPLVVCDDNNDGLVIVDLTTAELDILDVRQDDIEISYFETLTDAETNTNSISDPENYSNSSNPDTVYIKITNSISNCDVILPIDIIVELPPQINDFMVYDICENSESFIDLTEINTIALDDLNDVEIQYFSNASDAHTNTNPIDTNYTYQSSFDNLFIRASFISTGCYSVYGFNLNVNARPVANQPDDLISCDDDFDGLYEFDLTQQNPTILGTQNPNQFEISYHANAADAQNDTSAVEENYMAFNGEVVYARIENILTGCFETVAFTTIIHPLPVIDIGNPVLCLDNLPLLVSANTNNPGDQYEWSTGENTPQIEITETGSYWVRITSEFGCENIETFEINESESAIIEATEVIDFSDPNNITITVTGIGDYLYQLDDGQPQESNVFENVTMGYHTITIIDLNGCDRITREVVVVDVPKFMTPNNDGYFDTWHIVGIETLPGTQIKIFDRYGKLLKILSSETSGWDGTYNGHRMPSSDYWFVADVIRDDQSFQIKGHFTLKR